MSSTTETTHVDLNQAILTSRTAQPNPTGKVTTALVSFAALRVVLVTMPGGSLWEQHQTTGRITVQVLAGHIRLNAEGATHDLPTGHLLALESNIPHDVEALVDSTFLLTVARQPSTA